MTDGQGEDVWTDEEIYAPEPTPEEILAMASRGKALLDARVIELRPKLAAPREDRLEEAMEIADAELRGLPSAEIVDIFTFMIQRHYEMEAGRCREAAPFDLAADTCADGEYPGALLDDDYATIVEKEKVSGISASETNWMT